jgi:hypothetical protein
MAQLLPIGVGRQRKAAGRRQASLRQPGKIRRFRADPFRFGGERVIKVKDEGCHHNCLALLRRHGRA